MREVQHERAARREAMARTIRYGKIYAVTVVTLMMALWLLGRHPAWMVASVLVGICAAVFDWFGAVVARLNDYRFDLMWDHLAMPPRVRERDRRRAAAGR